MPEPVATTAAAYSLLEICKTKGGVGGFGIWGRDTDTEESEKGTREAETDAMGQRLEQKRQVYLLQRGYCCCVVLSLLVESSLPFSEGGLKTRDRQDTSSYLGQSASWLAKRVAGAMSS